MNATAVKSIQTTINSLLELQDINQNLDNLVLEINKIKEEAEQEEKKYQTKQNQYDKNYPYLERAEREYKELKIELEDIKVKIEELEERKKKIKTIKEFKAINKEIDTLNKKNAIRENDLLTKEEELEYKKDRIDKITTSIEEIKEVIQKKKEDLETLIQERKESIEEFTKEKQKLEKKLPAKIVGVFNRIYKHKYSMAIVPLDEQVCQGCFMKLPLQIDINVRRAEDLTYCPSCSRILYIDETEELSV